RAHHTSIRVAPLSPPATVALLHRMVREDCLARVHQWKQHVAARPLWEVVRDGPVRDVVRWLRLRPFERRCGRLAAPHEDVAVLHARVEFEYAPRDFLPAEFLLQCLDE